MSSSSLITELAGVSGTVPTLPSAGARMGAVGQLVYTAITSLDGFIHDAGGGFEWAAPSAEVHRYVNDLERDIGTHLYGRRMYEVLVAWETLPTEHEPDYIGDFATIWRRAHKVVYSSTLDSVSSENTELERSFDPGAVRALIAASDHDVAIGGAQLAASALAAGLVDVLHQFVTPVVVGGGQPWLAADVRLDLELRDEHRFADGVVHLAYGVVDRQT